MAKDFLKKGLAMAGLKQTTPKDNQVYAEDGDVQGELTEEEIALRDAFKEFDINNDGVIDKEELSLLLQKYLKMSKPPSQVQLGKIFNKVDLNQDGKIQFYEFKKMMQDRSKQKDSYRSVFERFDVDGDGYITKTELREALKKVDPDVKDEEVDTILRLADKDKDGKINFAEFLDFFV